MKLLNVCSVTLCALLISLQAIVAQKISKTPPTTRTLMDSAFSGGNATEDTDLIALPNPVREHDDNVTLIYRTRCIGTAMVTIYDAVGSTVFETSVSIKIPNAVGHKIAIPWDCRNQSGRFVGKGTYLAVVRTFDPENRPVGRHTVKIGVAF